MCSSDLTLTNGCGRPPAVAGAPAPSERAWPEKMTGRRARVARKCHWQARPPNSTPSKTNTGDRPPCLRGLPPLSAANPPRMADSDPGASALALAFALGGAWVALSHARDAAAVNAALKPMQAALDAGADGPRVLAAVVASRPDVSLDLVAWLGRDTWVGSTDRAPRFAAVLGACGLNLRGALAHAVGLGSLALVDCLLALGADVRERDGRVFEPVHLIRSLEVLDRLVAAGADVNARSDVGATPISCVASHLPHRTAYDLIRVLALRGSDVDDEYGSGGGGGGEDGYTLKRAMLRWAQSAPCAQALEACAAVWRASRWSTADPLSAQLTSQLLSGALNRLRGGGVDAHGAALAALDVWRVVRVRAAWARRRAALSARGGA